MDFTSTDLPIEQKYPKLVRDNIPVIIKQKNGTDVPTRILESDQEFEKFILKKIVEEATELAHSLEAGNMIEEIADVTELIDTLLKLKRWSSEDVDKVQEEKRGKNGGFEKRILMLHKA